MLMAKNCKNFLVIWLMKVWLEIQYVFCLEYDSCKADVTACDCSTCLQCGLSVCKVHYFRKVQVFNAENVLGTLMELKCFIYLTEKKSISSTLLVYIFFLSVFATSRTYALTAHILLRGLLVTFGHFYFVT